MVKREKWEISAFGWHEITGVYCVCSHDENKKTIVHYIGSSKNIGQRLNSRHHHYWRLWQSGIFVFIKYKATENYLSLEAALIKKLAPPLNKNGK